MTTSDPRATHRDDREDDDQREHRGLGQRILDAVLGEPGEQRHDAHVDRGEAARDAGYDPSESATDARRDAGEAGLTDRPAAGAGPDFVTPAYDPDRDRGYDPQAAGTAVADRSGTGPDPDRPFAAGDRGYEPSRDAGYVDAARAETDRTTGDRDDDYDTGRVDRSDVTADRREDRVGTEPVDTDRDVDRGARTAAAAGAAGAVGAAAAAAVGSTHRDHPDRDHPDRDHPDRGRSDRLGDTSFSEVDDTVAVDASDTGRGTPDTGADAGQGQAGVADENGSSGARERLVPAERAADYSSRWDALKGDFVDEPRRAVRSADELVGEVLDELQRLFADQRRDLEQSFDHDQASTEDLRLALRRYRSFFDRLLSF